MAASLPSNKPQTSIPHPRHQSHTTLQHPQPHLSKTHSHIPPRPTTHTPINPTTKHTTHTNKPTTTTAIAPHGMHHKNDTNTIPRIVPHYLMECEGPPGLRPHSTSTQIPGTTQTRSTIRHHMPSRNSLHGRKRGRLDTHRRL